MDADEPLMIVAAHPDDETIGAGIRLARTRPERVTIVHLTDGSPRNPADAERAGYTSRTEYALARRNELYDALKLVGITPDQCFELGAVDQEAHLVLGELICKLKNLIEVKKPDLVLTHPYEGGHPDHDSAAFCMYQAAQRASHQVTVCEFTSYHAGPDGLMETGQFLGKALNGEVVITFTAAEADLKRRMVKAFRTQQEVLAAFELKIERFRRAPAYDFTQPPHPGKLFYERMGWADGAHWRAKAREASTIQCN